MTAIRLIGGTVLFIPDQMNSLKPGGVSSGTNIENGKYSIAEDRGLTPGTYIVRVYSADDDAEPVEPQMPGPGLKTAPERIPAKYNMRSDLKLVVEETAKKVVFDIDMDTK